MIDYINRHRLTLAVIALVAAVVIVALNLHSILAWVILVLGVSMVGVSLRSR